MDAACPYGYQVKAGLFEGGLTARPAWLEAPEALRELAAVMVILALSFAFRRFCRRTSQITASSARIAIVAAPEYPVSFVGVLEAAGGGLVAVQVVIPPHGLLFWPVCVHDDLVVYPVLSYCV